MSRKRQSRRLHPTNAENRLAGCRLSTPTQRRAQTTYRDGREGLRCWRLPVNSNATAGPTQSHEKARGSPRTREAAR
eukprot:1327218-Lingulodinium_polyedra.AAC.1